MSRVTELRQARAAVRQAEEDRRTAVETARTALESAITVLSDDLYGRARPLPLFQWMPDELLRNCCNAFAQTAAQYVDTIPDA